MDTHIKPEFIDDTPVRRSYTRPKSEMHIQIDEIVRRENTFSRELIEALPGIFYVIDRRGRFLLWNRNLREVLKVNDIELAESNPLDFFEGCDKVTIANAIREVFDTGAVSVEAVMQTLDGKAIPYHFSGQRVEHLGEQVLIGMGLDISAQRENLRVTEGLLLRNQTLMHNSMEGIHILDIDGKVLEVNDAFCNMLGYSREELMQFNVTDWDDQFSAEELRARLSHFIGKSDIFETIHRRRDGTLIDVEICVTGVELSGNGYLFASSRDITVRKKIQGAMKRHEQVIETAMDGFWMTDMRGYLEEVNEAYATLSGYRIQELVGMHICQLDATEQPEDVKAHIDKIIAQGSDRFETRHRHHDGHLIDIEISTTFMPECQKFFVFCHDITRRKLSEQALRIAAATFETHDGILITDAQSNIIRVNHAFTKITGYSQDEALGKNPRFMSSGKHERDFYIKMWQQLLHAGVWAGEIWDKRKNGELYPKWMTISAVKNEQRETTQYVAIFSDITERKLAEEEIRNMAFYDPLTQLPNRRLFIERLSASLQASERRRDYGAVMFLDIDKFKTLNDTLGHECGDLMLIEIAQRIKSCIREMDTVARLGGDEFVILIENISTDEQDAAIKVGPVAEKIREALTQTYLLKKHRHHSSPSIGITLFHGNGVSVDELLRRADLAMYQVKHNGRNAVCFFDPLMENRET
ncbi:MAG: PAS domain S-box protein [Gallionella sp.]|jgi:diguanylate cyclase (GGDEF)-like protein/PAS domain S-box-containing protein